MKVLPAKLKTEQVIPSFALPSASGAVIGPGTYRRRRNLVLFFFHDGQCEYCKDVLATLARRYDELRDQNGQVLAISTASEQETRALADSLKLPFPLLYDSSGQIVDRFTYIDPDTGRVAPAVVVTDRFGAVYTTIQVDEAHPLRMKEIVEWLRFVEIQCPE